MFNILMSAVADILVVAALEKLQQLQSQMMHGSVAEEPEEGVSSLKNNKKKVGTQGTGIYLNLPKAFVQFF